MSARDNYPLLADIGQCDDDLCSEECRNALDLIDAQDTEIAGLRSALEFYADPETYFAVAFLFDPPCGGFESDFSEVDHPHFDLWPGKLARAALRGEHELVAEDIETPESWKMLALEFMRQASILENDSHFDDHLIEFRNDGWTVQHPVAERIDGSLFDCHYANWDAGDIGYRGRYVLTMDEEGQLNIGAEVTP